MPADTPQKSLLILPGSAAFMAFDAPPIVGDPTHSKKPKSLENNIATGSAQQINVPAGAVNCALEITAYPASKTHQAREAAEGSDDAAADASDRMAPLQAEDYAALCQHQEPPQAPARTILCQPDAHGFDHSCLLSALEAFKALKDPLGMPCAAAVAVVASDVGDREMEDLTAASCRAARFHMEPQPSHLDWGDLDRLAWRVHDFGWHVELRMDGRYLHAVEARLRDWPGPIVIENFGHFLKPIGPNDDGFRALLRLIDRDKAWVKLADTAALSVAGSPHFDDLADRARDLMKWAPERLVWGDNIAAAKTQGFDIAAYQAFQDWCDSRAQLQAIMVSNAETLYQLPPWPAPAPISLQNEDQSSLPSN